MDHIIRFSHTNRVETSFKFVKLGIKLAQLGRNHNVCSNLKSPRLFNEFQESVPHWIFKEIFEFIMSHSGRLIIIFLGACAV